MNRKRWTTWVALLLVPLLTAGGFLWGTAYADSGLGAWEEGRALLLDCLG